MWPTLREIKVLKSVNKIFFGPKLEKVGRKLFKMYSPQNLENGMTLKIRKFKALKRLKIDV